jgi:hypothetical protein
MQTIINFPEIKKQAEKSADTGNKCQSIENCT